MNQQVTYIPNELASAVKGGFVTASKEIKDKILNLNQEEINQLLIQAKDNILLLIDDSATKEYVDNKITEIIGNSPQMLETIILLSNILSDSLNDVLSLIQSLNSKADNSRVSALELNFNEKLGLKANISDVYTKQEIDNKELELNTKINKKANSSAVYTKLETYNRDEIDRKFSEVPRNNTVIVDSIPQNPVENVTYLVKDPNNLDVYNQYVYVDGQLIQLKDKEIDLSNLDINGDCVYNSIFTTNDNPDDDNIETTINLGNIPQGTSVSELSGKTISELFDMILFKEEYPNPGYSHTISLNVTPSLVKQDSTILLPNIVATWNNNIISDNNNITTKLDLVKPDTNLVEDWTSTAQSIYDISGTWTWKLYHNYGLGSYNVTSNFGNLREIIVPAANTYPNGTNNPITKVVKVTKPILYGQGDNLTEAELYPINEQHSITVPIGGQAKIVVPWENSLVTVEVDLGFGYMPIDGWTTTKLNGLIIMQKNDSYLAPVSHRITFTLRP